MLYKTFLKSQKEKKSQKKRKKGFVIENKSKELLNCQHKINLNQ